MLRLGVVGYLIKLFEMCVFIGFFDCYVCFCNLFVGDRVLG